jgi:hypothetical protein
MWGERIAGATSESAPIELCLARSDPAGASRLHDGQAAAVRTGPPGPTDAAKRPPKNRPGSGPQPQLIGEPAQL